MSTTPENTGLSRLTISSSSVVKSIHIIIHLQGDLTIHVSEYTHNVNRYDREEHTAGRRDDRSRRLFRTATMLVKRSVLEAASDAMKKLLDPREGFMDSTTSIVRLDDINIKSLEIWLRTLHNTMTPEAYNVPIKDIWFVISLSDKYMERRARKLGLRLELLQDWFANWWAKRKEQKIDFDEMSQLLFPALEFDHPEAFAYLTKRACYERVGHFIEKNPTHLRHMHLYPRAAEQLNAAAGSLRRQLYEGIDALNDEFRLSECRCTFTGMAHYAFDLALCETKGWPVERHIRTNSLTTLLDRLETFKPVTLESPPCVRCHYRNPTPIVMITVHKVENNFDGLCLDCMSRTKTGNQHEDYWMHAMFRREELDYASGCRIRHGQATWYFSYMGRQEERKLLEKKYRNGMIGS